MHKTFADRALRETIRAEILAALIQNPKLGLHLSAVEDVIRRLEGGTALSEPNAPLELYGFSNMNDYLAALKGVPENEHLFMVGDASGDKRLGGSGQESQKLSPSDKLRLANEQAYQNSLKKR